LKKTGLADKGYQYVDLDDCWAERLRDPVTQRMVPDKKKFPNGLKVIVDYAHSLDMKFGIYSDVGVYTCQKYPGSSGYFDIDAQTFADWGIDLLKFDDCYISDEQQRSPWLDYTKMSAALNATGKPIVYSICNQGQGDAWKWAPQISNMWRTTRDIDAIWTRVLANLDNQTDLYTYAGRGNWNDPDMIMVGVYNGNPQPLLTPAESRSHFSLWSIMASPLILGTENIDNIVKVEQWVLDIIGNEEVIAVDQDPLGVQGRIIAQTIIGVNSSSICTISACIRTNVWARPLVNNELAFVLFNRGGIDLSDPHFTSEQITIQWKDFRADPQQKFLVRDLWAHKDLGTFTHQFVSPKIDVHDVMMLKFTPL
jgi:alpha-galactosidase